MQFFTVATAFLASLAAAAPAPAPAKNAARSGSATVYFIGAADTGFDLPVTLGVGPVGTGNVLSVTYLAVAGDSGVACTAYGIDGSVTTAYAGQVRPTQDYKSL